MTKEKVESKTPQKPGGEERSAKGQSAEHHRLAEEIRKNNPTQAQQRNSERANQSGKGSGEGTTGMQRGDGHPKGR